MSMNYLVMLIYVRYDGGDQEFIFLEHLRGLISRKTSEVPLEGRHI